MNVVGVNETSITVSWNNPDGNVDEYVLKCNDTNVIVTNTTGTCANLTSGGTYNVLVCSRLRDVESRENCTIPTSVTTGESRIPLSDNKFFSLMF